MQAIAAIDPLLAGRYFGMVIGVNPKPENRFHRLVARPDDPLYAAIARVVAEFSQKDRLEKLEETGEDLGELTEYFVKIQIEEPKLFSQVMMALDMNNRNKVEAVLSLSEEDFASLNMLRVRMSKYSDQKFAELDLGLPIVAQLIGLLHQLN
jgi:hypothetical protein